MDPAIYAKILDFTKLFWGNKGNHNELISQKVLPKFNEDELRRALEKAGRGDLLPEAAALRQSLFDPDFEPLTTAKSPSGGKDIVQSSANNFYFGVTLAALKNFTEHYRLNSRVEKVNGNLVEHVYRAGPAGLFAQYLSKANEFLTKAEAYADPPQAKVIADLVRY